MMKALFYVLALLNLGFLLWQFHNGKFNPPVSQPEIQSSVLLVSEYERARRGALVAEVLDMQVRQYQQADVNRMLDKTWLIKRKAQFKPVLARDSKPDKQSKLVLSNTATKAQVPAKPVAALRPNKPTVMKCYQVGPFTDAAVAKQWLQGNALSSKQLMQKETAIPSDFQVYFPAAKTPEQSRLNKMMLIAKEQKDVWLIGSGELKGSYSLGVFNDKQRASNFKAQLSEKGIQAEIKQRAKTQIQWFVQVMLDKTMFTKLESKQPVLSACSSN